MDNVDFIMSVLRSVCKVQGEILVYMQEELVTGVPVIRVIGFWLSGNQKQKAYVELKVRGLV
jgi:hypothetical protein